MSPVVIFDIGGVLVPEGTRMEQLLDHLAALKGEFDREVFTDSYWAIRDEYDLGAADEQFWPPVFQRAGIESDPALVASAAAKDAELASTIAREPHQLLLEIADAGVPLGILSNAPHRMAQSVRESDWASVFAHLVFSSEHGLMKPDRAIYDLAASHLSDVEPSTIHFFDDRERNIVGAHAAGWHGHLWRSVDQARFELQSLGILTKR
ncbi:dUMP phosphatase [Corynebacterium glaucum]|uniref:HAD-IA family hydrolase n=1 Tax=Corynebacterium glaucum TaxID=187491 RepID=UPI0025B3500E|nr:HAD-IA family hydrolase [Corynebacterium glaucum]WJZ06831.1 dUMP phosphatase [Corynebacterium glaucum]